MGSAHKKCFDWIGSSAMFANDGLSTAKPIGNGEMPFNEPSVSLKFPLFKLLNSTSLLQDVATTAIKDRKAID